MRDYSKVGPRFWTGETGKYLRRLGRDAQVLGLYLFTCPNSNMIGLYYLPLTTAAHETGIPVPTIEELLPRFAEAPSEPLESPFEGVFARYDGISETVFVTEMARHQVGEQLTRKDNRHKAVVRELEQYRKSPFFNNFLDRYRGCFELEDVAPSKTLARGFKGPSEPLRSQEQDQKQDQKQDQEHAQRGVGEGNKTQLPAGREGPEPPYGPTDAWRDITECDPQAYLAWLAWRADENDVVPPRVRLQDAKFLAGKGAPEHQRAFVDELIRRRFRRLHDPSQYGGNSNGAARKPYTPAPTSTQLEDEAIARGIADGQSDRDIAAEIDVPLERVTAMREKTHAEH